MAAQEWPAGLEVGGEHHLLATAPLAPELGHHRGHESGGRLGLRSCGAGGGRRRARGQRIPCALRLASLPGRQYSFGCGAMSIAIVATEAAPKAIGPYAQAVVARGRWSSAPAKSPSIPRPGSSPVRGISGQETHRVLKNLGAVLHAAGASLATVVKTTVYLVNLGDFAAMNEIYASYFTRARPRGPRSKWPRCRAGLRSRSTPSP